MFRHRLELPNGQPADPPQFSAATQMWRPGDPVRRPDSIRLPRVPSRHDPAVDPAAR